MTVYLAVSILYAQTDGPRHGAPDFKSPAWVDPVLDENKCRTQNASFDESKIHGIFKDTNSVVDR